MVNPLYMMSKMGILYTRWLKGGPLMYQMTKGDPFVPDNQRVDSLHNINTICRWHFYYFSYFIFSDHSFPSLTSSPHLSKKVTKCIPVTASNAPKHLTNDKTNAIPRYPIMENNTDKPYTWNGFWNIKITHHVILIQYVWWGEKAWEKKENVNLFTINRIALQYKWKTYCPQTQPNHNKI